MGEHTTLIAAGDIVAPLPLPDRQTGYPTMDVPLPLPTLPRHNRHSGVVYALARIDASGRIADHTVTAALTWRPGDTLTASVTEDRAVRVVADPHGHNTLTAKGHVVIPAALRHVCGIRTGDQLFLAALPHHHILLIHPQTYLDTLYNRPQP